MVYNLTNLTSSDTVYNLFLFANNEATNGLFIMGIMFSIFFAILLTLVSSPNRDFLESLIVTTFICFVLSMILSYAHLLNFLFPLLFIIMTALSLLYLYLKQ